MSEQELWNDLQLNNYIVDRMRYLFFDNSSGENLIVLVARIGGENRYDYQECYDSLRGHPRFWDDEDEDDDRTYHRFYFTANSTEQEENVETVGPTME